MESENTTEKTHGTKRKANEDFKEASNPPKIERLDESTINKIAAGEVLQGPVNAIKELIENSVDASSTSVEIIAKDGGYKLIQVTDNGRGINRADLPILCERYTTSKIMAYEDLTSISTYGFRGEALASMSNVAHLTVTTKTADSSCAWRAFYQDGRLAPAKPGQSSEPKATAGRQGTQFTIEDLFYNLPRRKNNLRSGNEEYTKILDLVGRYAVHCTGVAFSCKKFGDSLISLSIQANASILDRIRQIYGTQVANELIHLEASNKEWGFKAEGWVSNVSYNQKKSTFILFINHRAVQSSTIKKAMEFVYSSFLPKNGHAFIYISLDIEPHRVDVNVHPTKKEVIFLDEDEVTGIISAELREKLSKCNESRTFAVKSFTADTSSKTSTTATNRMKTIYTPTGSRTERVYDHSLIRTDPRERKLTTMLRPAGKSSSSAAAANKGGNVNASEPKYTQVHREWKECRLASIKELRQEMSDAEHEEIATVIKKHVYVGIADFYRRIAAIQVEDRLMLVDYGLMANELFYQTGLFEFGNFSTYRFESPLSLRELLKVGTDIEKFKVSEGFANVEELDWDEVVENVYNQIMGRRDMLAEYFELRFSKDGHLESMPLLLKDWVPPVINIPQFLLRLGPNVDWKDEKQCFRSFLTELAWLNTPEVLMNPPIKALKSNKIKKDPNIGREEILVREHNERVAKEQEEMQMEIDKVERAQGISEVSSGMERKENEIETDTIDTTIKDNNNTKNSIENPDKVSDNESKEPDVNDDADDYTMVEETEDPEITARRAEVENAIEHIFFPTFRSRLVPTNVMQEGMIEIANLKGLFKHFERC